MDATFLGGGFWALFGRFLGGGAGWVGFEVWFGVVEDWEARVGEEGCGVHLVFCGLEVWVGRWEVGRGVYRGWGKGGGL